MTMETIVIEKIGDGRPWEGCINSVNYRIERGRAVTVPKEVAEVIRRSETERRRSLVRMRRFTEENGARL